MHPEPDRPDAVAVFRRCAEGDAPAEELDAWLADDVWMAPPTYWTRWDGAPAVRRLLGYAAGHLEGLRYERVWHDGDTAALLFEATVGGRTIRGVDILHLDDGGRITGVEIVARPPNAVAALGERMQRSVREDPFFAGGAEAPDPRRAAEIVTAYEARPQTDDEYGWSDDSTREMIADESW